MHLVIRRNIIINKCRLALIFKDFPDQFDIVKGTVFSVVIIYFVNNVIGIIIIKEKITYRFRLVDIVP